MNVFDIEDLGGEGAGRKGAAGKGAKSNKPGSSAAGECTLVIVVEVL